MPSPTRLKDKGNDDDSGKALPSHARLLYCEGMKEEVMEMRPYQVVPRVLLLASVGLLIGCSENKPSSQKPVPTGLAEEPKKASSEQSLPVVLDEEPKKLKMVRAALLGLEELERLCKALPPKPVRVVYRKSSTPLPEAEKKKREERERRIERQMLERNQKLSSIRSAERKLATSNPVYTVTKSEVFGDRELQICDQADMKTLELVGAKLEVIMMEFE